MAGKYDVVDKYIVTFMKDRDHRHVTVGELFQKLRCEVNNDITIIDRRMQSLKKKGIVFNSIGKGWGLVNHG